MIAIIDYDAGNLNSVQKAFQFLGKEAVITRDSEVIRSASHVVLPGVGAFADAMNNLQQYGLVDVVREAAFSGKPFWVFVWACSFCLIRAKNHRV